MAKADIRASDLLGWDTYKEASPEVALPAIYAHAGRLSQTAREWYWRSIKAKRQASQISRWVAFALLVGGSAAPIVAGIYDDTGIRLHCTQAGVAALALAGLLLYADRVFGWSTGWLRYVATVTAMEDKTRRFEREWAGFLVGKQQGISSDDVRALFDVARRFEEEIAKLQTDETEKWIAEFNSGLALLGEMIKNQRESVEKAVDATRAVVEERQRSAQAGQKAQASGAVEIAFAHRRPETPVQVHVNVDEEAKKAFLGFSWVKRDLRPGQHTITVEMPGSPPRVVQKLIDVPAGGVARAEISVE
jgi:hypothetical protein